jgi:nucleoside-diphosphate-sugar epimerase
VSRRVLVIGGTGFLGRRIAEEFHRHGDQVAVLTRGLTSAPNGLELLTADRRDAASLRRVLEHNAFDIVVDNIAYDADDVRITLDALGKTTGHYLVTSSTAVYADRFVRRPLQEADADLQVRAPVDDPNPFHSRLGHAYANNKRAAEQVVSHGPVPWTILRPPVILGADDRTRRVWWFVQRLLDRGPILIPDWGPGRVFQVVWANDVARAFVKAAGNPAAFGQAYNVAQLELYTAESWIEAAAAILNVKASYTHVPEHDLDNQGLPGYVLPVAGRPFGHLLVDTQKIRCQLEFEPSPEATWLSQTLRGCEANPPASPSNGYERRDQEVRLARQRIQA